MRWYLALPVCVLTSSALADTAFSPFDHPRPPARRQAAVTTGYTGLGAESVTEEMIAEFTAPPLDRKVTRTIQAMLDIRAAGTGVITAKGDRMFFTSSVTGSPHVWRQDGPMRLAIQLTGGEDRTSVVAIAPDDSWLVVSRDVGGEENPGLYVMKPDGGPLQVIQHKPKVQTTLQYIEDSGKALYYRANDVEPSSYAIYRYDVAAKTAERVFDHKGLWAIADEKNGVWLMTKELGNAHDEIYQYDTKTRQLTPLLGQGEVEEYTVRFGAKPNQILVRTNKLGDFHRLYTLDAGKLTPITPEVKHDIESLSIDHARLRIYYTLNEDGYRRAKVLDARTFKELPLPRLPEADTIQYAGASRNGRYIQLSVEGPTLAPTSVTYDWRTRKATAWRVPSTPEIDTKTFATISLESYPARDGTKIPMFVRRPAHCATQVCPVIVSFHGGPESQAVAGFSAEAQMYVDAGFVYVQPNVRGSSGYGKTWLHADDGPKRLAVITDIEDVAKHIRFTWARGGVMPKIGVMGGSYGGYSTLMAMTYFAGAYDAGVQRVGMSNLRTFLMNTAPYRRILRISEYGDPVKDKEALAQLSPITHVAKIKAPLLSIQGVNDPRVPVGEAVQIYRELERRSVPGGLILFPDEGHGTSKRENRVLAIGHSIAFFQKYLK